MSPSSKFLYYKNVILYGLMMAILVLFLKWLQWKFIIMDHSMEIYIGIIAFLFTILGVWLAFQLFKAKTEIITVEKKVYVPINESHELNETALNKLNLSNREYEVLQLLALGLSNAEIGEQLFLSVSTVKTHVSNLLIKINAKNRTQAMAIAKNLKIIR